jgi:hypothetical protein
MKTASELIGILWYNHHIWPATYGPCCECKVESARGGGLCAKCAETQLGEQVGAPLAKSFHDSIKQTKLFEREIYDYIEDSKNADT